MSAAESGERNHTQEGYLNLATNLMSKVAEAAIFSRNMDLIVFDLLLYQAQLAEFRKSKLGLVDIVGNLMPDGAPLKLLSTAASWNDICPEGIQSAELKYWCEEMRPVLKQYSKLLNEDLCFDLF
ncbi:uncharacterized protein PV09_06614 [Verruconis gallopava]|uniref:Uncharacterized protein n=1 Tax=Verruconis gallopava TaxID=253628 RepID=A0A0D2A6D3_9PEZI|nr:uncharacterized protein PV09_06614 [Verruconis gallopava]KIW02125.1 hypothetical protein PV09_06614 [Verruconis gallopava]